MFVWWSRADPVKNVSRPCLCLETHCPSALRLAYVITAKTDYGEKLYEGKAKIVFKGPQGSLFHYFKDSATAFNAQKKAEFSGKGELNLAMSVMIFTHLAKAKVPTHFIRQVDERTFETQALQMIPVEVVVRNRMAGSLARRLGEPEGAVFERPLVEWYLKNDAKGDPQVSEDLLLTFYKIDASDLKRCSELALQVNSILSPLFAKVNLTLVDFKLEFGKDAKGNVLLADEFSPDTCRLWDSTSGEKMDKDRFRFDLGDLLTGYREVFDRMKKVLSV